MLTLISYSGQNVGLGEGNLGAVFQNLTLILYNEQKSEHIS